MAKFRIVQPDTLKNALESAIIPSINVFPDQDESEYLSGLNQAEQDSGGSFIRSAQLGTVVYDRFTLLSDGTRINDNFVVDEVVIAVNHTKQIVKTTIQGRDGTVKEYISLDDYQINVRGVIVDKNPNRRDNERIELLKSFCDLNTQIKVASKWLTLFGITSVVISDYSISQQAGTRQVAFSLNLLSDEDIELQLTEEQNVNT